MSILNISTIDQLYKDHCKLWGDLCSKMIWTSFIKFTKDDEEYCKREVEGAIKKVFSSNSKYDHKDKFLTDIHMCDIHFYYELAFNYTGLREISTSVEEFEKYISAKFKNLFSMHLYIKEFYLKLKEICND